jgi:hypothetical protein
MQNTTNFGLFRVWDDLCAGNMLSGFLVRRAHENWGNLCADNMCFGITCHGELMNIGATCAGTTCVLGALVTGRS